jgi:hypothetical protein
MRGFLGSVAVLVLLGTAALGFGMMNVTPEDRQRWDEEDAIERCREAQDDPLQELATRRLIRAGCDRMEAQFRTKWGRSP